MDIELDDEKMKDATRNTRKNSEDFESGIEIFVQELEKLKLNWTGQDADKFFKSTDDFFGRAPGISRCMRNMARFTDRATKDIKGKDEEFSEELQTEVYEEYIDYEQNTN